MIRKNDDEFASAKFKTKIRGQLMLRIFMLFCAMALLSCAPKIVPVDSRSYSVGSTITTTVGNPMLQEEKQTVANGSRWVGLAFSPTGFEQVIRTFKQELIYGGRVGNSLKIAYREYQDDYARAPFYQDLQYDLRQSKEIAFKNYRLSILKADNSQVTFKVLSD